MRDSIVHVRIVPVTSLFVARNVVRILGFGEVLFCFLRISLLESFQFLKSKMVSGLNHRNRQDHQRLYTDSEVLYVPHTYTISA